MKPEDITPEAALNWIRNQRRYLIVRGYLGYHIASITGKRLTESFRSNGAAALDLVRKVKPTNLKETATPRRTALSQRTQRGMAGLDFSLLTK